ncbi:MAG: hypothetical protein GKR89_32510 [Candidatus Latescibacteria bacterium]|nr:hypothetical protein [Candidatus Latescibacterota bacterium]
MNRLLPTALLCLTAATALFAQSPPYGLSQRVANESFLVTTGGESLEEMQLVEAFPELFFERPIFLTHSNDGSNRLFAVEQSGVIRVFNNHRETSQTLIFLDIRSRVNDGPNEAGLLSVAFHPNYRDNGLFFVYYNTGNLKTRISQFSVSANPDSAAVDSERILFELEQPAGNHNGGQIAFGPDGFLYIGLGDGGGGGDPFRTGQDLTSLLATIMRIDIDSQDEGLEYAIPPDNPYVGNDQGWRPEIWAWGLRNPWRFSFDRVTGQLWAGDVGQNRWEEVDLIEKGGNYGWNRMEGFHCFSGDCEPELFTPPVLEYDHDAGRSITGGYVYRGPRLPQLYGVYLYADFVTRRVWGLRWEEGQLVDNRLLAIVPGNVSSFGEDESGEVYVVTLNGAIYRFEPADPEAPPGTIPATLAQSGLFADPTTQSPAPGLIPYQVNAELWSDGAAKTRLLALPGISQIDFSADGPWDFPANTVAVKNFYLEMEAGQPESRRIVETRLLVKRARGPLWDGFSYMWNDDGSDAVLLEGAASREYTIDDPQASGGTRSHRHDFPSRQQCAACHTPAAGYVLGLNTAQLNRDYDYDGVADNQLRSYNHIGLFTDDIGEDTAVLPRLPGPFAREADLAQRARAYLAANCSQCHRPGGPVRTDLDLRFGTPLSQTQALGVPPTLADMGLVEPFLIAPGQPEQSALYLRLLNLEPERMPPLASNRIDEAGAQLVAAWIESLGDPTAIEKENDLPQTFSLEQNAPNPFNSSTLIPFSLARAGHIDLALYNLAGQRVATLLNAYRQAGSYSFIWVGRDEQGQGLASGVYFYHLRLDGHLQRRKLMLVR